MLDVVGLLGDNRLHADSSIVLTYDLDLVFYDGYLRRTLAAAGVTNQIVFCDMPRYEEQLPSLSAVRFLGRKYSTTPVVSSGVFHPKLYLLLGPKHGRLVIGSGNATIGGMLRNAELFGLFDYHHDETNGGPHPAFATCLELIGDLAQRAPSLVRKQLDRAMAWAPWLKQKPTPDDREVLAAGPGRPPLLEQLRHRLAEKRIDSVLVCASSFDRRLTGLSGLASITRRTRARCIVQQHSVRLDGAAVRRLGKKIAWFPFVDPYPHATTQRRDARAHAKLFVFEGADEEYVFFGSANASAPALTVAKGNTELLVALPPAPRGSTVERLGLSKSLSQAAINDALGELKWQDDRERQRASVWFCHLTGAAVGPERIALTVEAAVLPRGAALSLTAGSDDHALQGLPIVFNAEESYAPVVSLHQQAAVARIVGREGTQLSNPVALTWPQVLPLTTSSRIGGRYQDALASMQDGVVLGTVLFELLDRVRDFEVVIRRGGRHQRKQHGDHNSDETDGATRSEESFYTDNPDSRTDPGAGMGDRGDLDLLASLVQPLYADSKTSTRIETEDIDESSLGEERQRAEIDRGQRPEKPARQEAPSAASREAIERARRRFEHRLDRAAESLESALSAHDALSEIPIASLVRQLWMVHIGAFLTGRLLPTEEGDQVPGVGPREFAVYVLRVCRSFAGNSHGGLLNRLPRSSWVGLDGELLTCGLSYLWTYAVWACAYELTHVQLDGSEDDEPWEATECAPELVVARYIASVRQKCVGPELDDIQRRLPAWRALREGWFDEWSAKLLGIAEFIANAESNPPKTRWQELEAPVSPGRLVYNSLLGVTVSAGMHNQNFALLDLGRPGKPLHLFKHHVFFCPSASFRLRWRDASWLREAEG